MNKHLVIVTFFALCTIFATDVSAQKCTSDDSTLIATFAGVSGQPPYLITSDGLGSYTTTKSKGSTTNVMFQICNGSNDFVMDLISSKRTAKVQLVGGITTSSFMNFDRVANVPVTADSEPFAAFCGGRNGDGSIILDTPNTTTADNYGGCGLDAGGYFVRRNVGMQLTNGHSLRFQNSPYGGGTLAAGTSYIRIYHPTVSSWTLSPEDVPYGPDYHCGSIGSCGAVIYQPNGGVPATVQGYTIGRFQLSITSSKIYP